MAQVVSGEENRLVESYSTYIHTFLDNELILFQKVVVSVWNNLCFNSSNKILQSYRARSCMVSQNVSIFQSEFLFIHSVAGMKLTLVKWVVGTSIAHFSLMYIHH